MTSTLVVRRIEVCPDTVGIVYGPSWDSAVEPAAEAPATATKSVVRRVCNWIGAGAIASAAAYVVFGLPDAVPNTSRPTIQEDCPPAAAAWNPAFHADPRINGAESFQGQSPQLPPASVCTFIGNTQR